MIELAIPASWHARALVLEGSGGDATADLAAWFGDDEMSTAGAFKFPRRRQEWLLSRYAAKRLAERRGLPRSIAIVRPRLASGEWISISHSHGAVAAALDDEPVGIDVERVRPLDEGLVRHFLTEGELAVLKRCALAHRILHFWCAKEAAWKRRGGEIRLLRDVPLTLESEHAEGLLFESVETFVTGEVIVALTRSTS